MNILITGCNGQLGNEIQLLEKQYPQHKFFNTDVEELDITNQLAVFDYIGRHEIDGIINCAAYTAVDKAEDEPELARRVNVDATAVLARMAKMLRAKFMYISTDYVFPGMGTSFYDTDDPKAPRNVYGATKLAGEEVVQDALDEYFIVRTSWVFGKNGKNFVRTMLNLADTHDEVQVVDDQTGSPTYTPDLARLLADMIVTDKYGVYHVTNEGVCTWAEFAAEIFRQAGRDTHVRPVPTSAYKTRAHRPANSRMSKACLDEAGFKRLPDWHDALGRYLDDIGEKA